MSTVTIKEVTKTPTSIALAKAYIGILSNPFPGMNSESPDSVFQDFQFKLPSDLIQFLEDCDEPFAYDVVARMIHLTTMCFSNFGLTKNSDDYSIKLDLSGILRLLLISILKPSISKLQDLNLRPLSQQDMKEKGFIPYLMNYGTTQMTSYRSIYESLSLDELLAAARQLEIFSEIFRMFMANPVMPIRQDRYPLFHDDLIQVPSLKIDMDGSSRYASHEGPKGLALNMATYTASLTMFYESIERLKNQVFYHLMLYANVDKTSPSMIKSISNSLVAFSTTGVSGTNLDGTLQGPDNNTLYTRSAVSVGRIGVSESGVFNIRAFGETYPTGVDNMSIPPSTVHFRNLMKGLFSVPGRRYPASTVVASCTDTIDINVTEAAMPSLAEDIGDYPARAELENIMLNKRFIHGEFVDIPSDVFGTIGFTACVFDTPEATRYTEMLCQMLSEHGWLAYTRKVDIRGSEVKLYSNVNDAKRSTVDLKDSFRFISGTNAVGNLGYILDDKLSLRSSSQPKNIIESIFGVQPMDTGVININKERRDSLPNIGKALLPIIDKYNAEATSNTNSYRYLDCLSRIIRSASMTDDLSWGNGFGIEEAGDMSVIQIRIFPQVSQLRISDLLMNANPETINEAPIMDCRMFYPLSSRMNRVGNAYCSSQYLIQKDDSSFSSVRDKSTGKINLVPRRFHSIFNGIRLSSRASDTDITDNIAISEIVALAEKHAWRRLCQLMQKNPKKASSILKTLHQLNPSRAVLMNSLES